MDLSQILPGLFTTGVNAYLSNKAADAATAAGQQAAQAAAFRPVGITTRFGRSGFQYGPDGRLIGAGYQVAPDVAAMREGLLGLAGGGLQQAYRAAGYQPAIEEASTGLFNLGRGYLAQTPQQAAQQYMQQQQQLLAPGREQQLAALQNQQFQKGRSGLAVGATQAGFQAGAPGLQATNPQMAAYYNAMAQQDANLAAQAMEAGQRQTTFGQGLLGGAMNIMGGGYGLQQKALEPFQQSFGLGQSVENAGLNALTQSIGLGAGSPAAAQALQNAANQANALDMNRNATIANKLADPVAQLIGSIFKQG